jgi:hypothetical protein
LRISAGGRVMLIFNAPHTQSHQSAVFRIGSRPQQKPDRWIGQYSFRRSLIAFLRWRRANLQHMGSRNGHSPLLVWWAVFRLIRRLA